MIMFASSKPDIEQAKQRYSKPRTGPERHDMQNEASYKGSTE
jgi:hypothetical protein